MAMVLVFKMSLVVFLLLSPADRGGLCQVLGDEAMEHFQCAEGTLVVVPSEDEQFAEFFFICKKRMTKEGKDGKSMLLSGVQVAESEKGRLGRLLKMHPK